MRGEERPHIVLIVRFPTMYHGVWIKAQWSMIPSLLLEQIQRFWHFFHLA